MTTEEATGRIRNIIDREDTAYLSNSEIQAFIVMAVDEFVQQYYTGFETTQDNRDKLQNLVVDDAISISDTSPSLLSSMTAANVNYYRLLSAHVTSSPKVNAKIIQISDLNAYLNDPFNKADSGNPALYLAGGKINSLGLSSSTSLTVKYLKQASDITDLDSHTHEEVCQIAARKVLATLGDPRYQAFQAELTERRV
jgi:hypothetical protein